MSQTDPTAEQQVRLVQSVVEHGFSSVLIADSELPDPVVKYINPAFAQAVGCRPEDLVGRRLSAVPSLARVSQLVRAAMPEGKQFLEEMAPYEASSGQRWGEWRVGPVTDFSGRISHYLVIFRDITERKRLEREILEISDRERRAIGQDLHDGLCQQLAGVELMCQVLEQKISRRSGSAAQQAAEIGRHVRDAIAQTRSLARGLSPVTLEFEGLESALNELAANTERMFGILCEVQCGPRLRVPNLAVSTHLYRIAQEAVSNAIKHGKAHRVSIRLATIGDRLELSIVDDGQGLLELPDRQRGMGLSIMHYRAGMIGGSLTVENVPAPGSGVRVICSAPFTAAAPSSAPRPTEPPIA